MQLNEKTIAYRLSKEVPELADNYPDFLSYDFVVSLMILSYLAGYKNAKGLKEVTYDS